MNVLIPFAKFMIGLFCGSIRLLRTKSDETVEDSDSAPASGSCGAKGVLAHKSSMKEGKSTMSDEASNKVKGSKDTSRIDTDDEVRRGERVAATGHTPFDASKRKAKKSKKKATHSDALTEKPLMKVKSADISMPEEETDSFVEHDDTSRIDKDDEVRLRAKQAALARQETSCERRRKKEQKKPASAKQTASMDKSSKKKGKSVGRSLSQKATDNLEKADDSNRVEKGIEARRGAAEAALARQRAAPKRKNEASKKRARGYCAGLGDGDFQTEFFHGGT